MSKRQDHIYLLEYIKSRMASEAFSLAYPQNAINMLNEIIEQISKTETVRLRKELAPFYCPADETVKSEFAREIANFIMKNGYAEPKPVEIDERTKFEIYELEISFIRR